jgi:hypothetical protein
MNKLLLVFSVLSASTISFTALHRATERTQAARSSQDVEWEAARNRLAELNAASVSLRNEVTGKRGQLRHASSHPRVSSELLSLLEGATSAQHSPAWAELRDRLGIGWDSSDDYVLVSKRVLKKISFLRLVSAVYATDTASAVLALSQAEQSGIRAALQHARDLAWSRVQRTEPAGDIVAQYTIPADPLLEHSISNNFSADITAVLGVERADLFLHQGWRELKSEFAPDEQEPVTMTIRRSAVDGESKLFWEIRQGNSLSSSEIRYATYPRWFWLLFPGGWQGIAQREGFELPKDFEKQQQP